MIDNWARISILCSYVSRPASIRIVNGLALDIFKLRHPLTDIFAIRIKLLTLQAWIKHTKVRLRINAHARRKAPSTIIARKVTINEVAMKESLSRAPIKQQILGQERGHNHAAAIVHVRRVTQLPHRRIDERESRAALAPRGKVLVIVLPFDARVRVLERLGHAHVRPVREHVLVEVAPGYLTDPAADAT